MSERARPVAPVQPPLNPLDDIGGSYGQSRRMSLDEAQAEAAREVRAVQPPPPSVVFPEGAGDDWSFAGDSTPPPAPVVEPRCANCGHSEYDHYKDGGQRCGICGRCDGFVAAPVVEPSAQVDSVRIGKTFDALDHLLWRAGPLGQDSWTFVRDTIDMLRAAAFRSEPRPQPTSEELREKLDALVEQAKLWGKSLAGAGTWADQRAYDTAAARAEVERLFARSQGIPNSQSSTNQSRISSSGAAPAEKFEELVADFRHHCEEWGAGNGEAWLDRLSIIEVALLDHERRLREENDRLTESRDFSTSTPPSFTNG